MFQKLREFPIAFTRMYMQDLRAFIDGALEHGLITFLCLENPDYKIYQVLVSRHHIFIIKAIAFFLFIEKKRIIIFKNQSKMESEVN